MLERTGEVGSWRAGRSTPFFTCTTVAIASLIALFLLFSFPVLFRPAFFYFHPLRQARGSLHVSCMSVRVMLH